MHDSWTVAKKDKLIGIVWYSEQTFDIKYPGDTEIKITNNGLSPSHQSLTILVTIIAASKMHACCECELWSYYERDLELLIQKWAISAEELPYEKTRNLQ